MADKNAEIFEIAVPDLESLKSMIARHSDAFEVVQRSGEIVLMARRSKPRRWFGPILLLLGLLSQTPIDMGEATRATDTKDKGVDGAVTFIRIRITPPPANLT